MLTLKFLIEAYVMGWAVAAPIGPVNLEMIRRALRHRIMAGFMVGVGATMIDALYMFLSGFGIGFLLHGRTTALVCFVVGGGFMAFLAWGALKEAWVEWKKAHAHGAPVAEHAASDDLEATSPQASAAADPKSPSLLRCWLVGLAMTASNPMTLAFWSTLPSNLFKGQKPTIPQIFAASGCVWLGTISWVSLLMLVLLGGRRFVGPRFFAVVSGLGGLAMLYFAGRFWYNAATIDAVLQKMGGG